jgi:hypothetical protein
MAMGAETDRANYKVMEEARGRLEHLGVDPSKGASLHTLSDDMSRLRSFPLPRMAEGPITAEFFVILKSDGNSVAFKAQDVKFATGSEQLKLPLKLLAPMDFKLKSPDGVATTLVRRGVLACYPRSGCSLSFLDPSIVRDLK